MKTKKSVVLTCLLILAVGLSCRMVDTLTGNESAGTVDRLWADVPPFEGAAKADMAIPLAARLIIRAAMQRTLQCADCSDCSRIHIRQRRRDQRRLANLPGRQSEILRQNLKLPDVMLELPDFQISRFPN